jgi:hypothetical protein
LRQAALRRDILLFAPICTIVNESALLFKKWGSCLSTVDSTGSVYRWVSFADLPAPSWHLAGVSLLVCRRAGMCCVPGTVAVDHRLPLPKVRGCKKLADGGWALVLFRMWAQGVGDGGHGLRPQPYPAPGMVCRGLVHDQPEAWGKRARPAAVAGAGKLSNRMDHVAEAAARPWCGQGEIVCVARSRSMRPMWAASHRGFADVARTASSSWQSPSKYCRQKGSAARVCSVSMTCRAPAWSPLSRPQSNPARRCAPTAGKATTAFPRRDTGTTQSTFPAPGTPHTFPCPNWLSAFGGSLQDRMHPIVRIGILLSRTTGDRMSKNAGSRGGLWELLRDSKAATTERNEMTSWSD